MTIKQTRKQLGLSQKKMGQLMGMEQPSIARIEKGERKETRVHIQLLRAMAILNQHGLLEGLE